MKALIYLIRLTVVPELTIENRTTDLRIKTSEGIFLNEVRGTGNEHGKEMMIIKNSGQNK